MASETITASDLIKPEVWAPVVGATVPKKAVMAPFATIDSTLEGQPGDRINFSKWGYIGDAKDIGENEVIETRKLTMTTDSMGIKEAANGIAITDKAVLTAMGQPQEQAVGQLSLSVARLLDSDLRTAAAATRAANEEFGTPASSPLRFDADGVLDYDSFVDGTTLFGDEWEPSDFLGFIIHSKQYATLRKDPNFISADKVGAGNQAILTGRVGQISGVDVVISDRTKVTGTGADAVYEGLLIRRNALTLAYKRRPIIEKARDIEARKTIVTTNVHYGVQRTDDNGVLVFTSKAA